MEDLYPSRGREEKIIQRCDKTVYSEKSVGKNSDNISPFPRTNAFFVYNSIENKPQKPFGAPGKRADFLCLKDFSPLKSE